MRTVILVAVLAGLAPGCGLTVGPSNLPSVAYYEVVLGADRSAKARTPVGSTVVLRPFTQSSALDRDGVRYRTSDVEGGYWTFHRWSEPVESMVRSVLARDLERTGVFDAVVLIDNAGLANYMVDAAVHRFDEVDAADGWSAVVEITFEVVRTSDGVLLLHDRIRAKSKSDSNSVPEVVRALGRALESVFDDFYDELARVTAGGG